MAVTLKSTFGAALAVALVAALSGCGKPAAPGPAPAATPTPAMEKPPTPEPATQKAATQIEDTRPVVAAFGDSISAGFGVEPGRSYPDDLQRLIDAAGYRYRVVNLGVSGDTTTDGVERLPSALALHPAVVILEFGGNDGLRGQPVAGAENNLAKMIEAFRDSGAKVVLAGMTLPRNYGPDYIRSFEEMYARLGRKYRVSEIPFLLDGVGGHAALMQPDGLHPTAEGAAIVAQTAMRYLEPLLSKR